MPKTPPGRPFIIRYPEPGMAHVHHRGDDRMLGYLLQDFHLRWETYILPHPDLPGVFLNRFRHAKSGAEAVWAHHLKES